MTTLPGPARAGSDMGPQEIASAVRVVLAADRLSATLTIEAGTDAVELTPGLIEAIANSRDLAPTSERSTLIREALERYAAQHDTRQPFQATIARGEAPIHGQHGWLEIDPQFASAARRSGEGEITDGAHDLHPGSVDYHARSVFQFAKAGQRVATLHPPREGRDGIDVTGRSLAAKRARALPFTGDGSVRVDADGGVYASVSGLPEFSEAWVRIAQSLRIPEYVDYSTGNIDFAGDCAIDKGIRDGFVLNIGGSLHVHGLVEAAALCVGADCTLDGGIAGRHKAKLEVGRTLHAKYLDSVPVRVGGDLVVQNEITSSDLDIKGRCRSPACSVFGGVLRVTRECEIAQLGNESGVPTVAIIGRDAALESLTVSLAALVPQFEGKSASEQAELAHLKRQPTRRTAERAEKLTELEFAAANTNGKLAAMKRRLGKLLELLASCSRATLTVRRVIFPGTKVSLGRYGAVFTHEIRGPVRIALGPGGQIEVTDLAAHTTTPLAAVARVSLDPHSLDLDSLQRQHGAAA